MNDLICCECGKFLSLHDIGDGFCRIANNAGYDPDNDVVFLYYCEKCAKYNEILSYIEND